MRKDQLFEDRTERATSRTFKKTGSFKKGKIANFRIYKTTFEGKGNWANARFPTPSPFFSSINFEGYPLPEIPVSSAPERSAVSKRKIALAPTRQCSIETKSVCKAVLKWSVKLKSAAEQRDICPLRGYPARHPNIVTRFFTFVKEKFKIIYKKTRRMSVPRGHLSGLATTRPVPIGTDDWFWGTK